MTSQPITSLAKIDFKTTSKNNVLKNFNYYCTKIHATSGQKWSEDDQRFMWNKNKINLTNKSIRMKKMARKIQSVITNHKISLNLGSSGRTLRGGNLHPIGLTRTLQRYILPAKRCVKTWVLSARTIKLHWHKFTVKINMKFWRSFTDVQEFHKYLYEYFAYTYIGSR